MARRRRPSALVWLAAILASLGFVRFGIGFATAHSTGQAILVVVDSLLLVVLAVDVVVAKPWGLKLGVLLSGLLVLLGAVRYVAGDPFVGLAEVAVGLLVLVVLLVYRDEFRRRTSVTTEDQFRLRGRFGK